MVFKICIHLLQWSIQIGWVIELQFRYFNIHFILGHQLDGMIQYSAIQILNNLFQWWIFIWQNENHGEFSALVWNSQEFCFEFRWIDEIECGRLFHELCVDLLIVQQIEFPHSGILLGEGTTPDAFEVNGIHHYHDGVSDSIWNWGGLISKLSPSAIISQSAILTFINQLLDVALGDVGTPAVDNFGWFMGFSEIQRIHGGAIVSQNIGRVLLLWSEFIINEYARTTLENIISAYFL